MEDLVKLIVQQVNITEEQAKQTVNTVLRYVRDQLPAPMAAQVDTFLASGGATAMPGLADMMKNFGDLAKGVGETLGAPIGGTVSRGDAPNLSR